MVLTGGHILVFNGCLSFEGLLESKLGCTTAQGMVHRLYTSLVISLAVTSKTQVISTQD